MIFFFLPRKQLFNKNIINYLQDITKQIHSERHTQTYRKGTLGALWMLVWIILLSSHLITPGLGVHKLWSALLLMKTSIIILLCGAVEYLEAFCHWGLYACTQDKEKYALKHLWIVTDLTASDTGLIIKQLWNTIHLKKNNKFSPAGNWLWAYSSDRGEHVLLRSSTLKLLPNG